MLLLAFAHSHLVDFQVVLMLLLGRSTEQSHGCLILVVRASSSFPEQPNGQNAVRECWRCGCQSAWRLCFVASCSTNTPSASPRVEEVMLHLRSSCLFRLLHHRCISILQLLKARVY